MIQGYIIIKKLIDICSIFNFEIHVEESTHISGSILDQFVSTCENDTKDK